MSAAPPGAAPRIPFPRWVGALVGFIVGGGIATFVPLGTDEPAQRLALMLACALGGAALGAVRPPRMKLSNLPEGSAALPGEPVPLGGLAAAFIAETNQRLGTAFGLGLLAFVGILSLAFAADLLLGMSMSLAFLAGLSVVLYLIAIACSAVLPPFLLDGPTRSSFVVQQWAGAREWKRLDPSPRAAVGFPTSPKEREAWIASKFDRDAPRAVDVEILLMSGDVATAREAAAGLPAATAMERFSKSEREAFVHYQATGEVDTGAMNEAIAEIPPGLDRIEAGASLALFEARTLLPDGDWRARLLAARDTIPEGDTLILLRDYGWPAFVILLVRLWPLLALLAVLFVALLLLE